MLNPFTAMRFGEFLFYEQRNIPFGSTLLIVSPLFTPAIATALHRLHVAGRRIVFISVDTKPPESNLAPCTVFHVPPNPEFAAWTRQFNREAA